MTFLQPVLSYKEHIELIVVSAKNYPVKRKTRATGVLYYERADEAY